MSDVFPVFVSAERPLERDALAEVESRLDAAFARAVALIRASSGRVIVTGVGKSGLIGRKIAATLTSTGTPATFLHPVESVHGDLGIVGPADVVILLSKSGETSELLLLLEALERYAAMAQEYVRVRRYGGWRYIARKALIDATYGPDEEAWSALPAR